MVWISISETLVQKMSREGGVEGQYFYDSFLDAPLDLFISVAPGVISASSDSCTFCIRYHQPNRSYHSCWIISVKMPALDSVGGPQPEPEPLTRLPFKPVTKSHILHCSYNYWHPK